MWKSLKKEFDEKGTILVNDGALLLPAEKLHKLEEFSNLLPLEHVEIGDADEPNYLDVGRFMTDVEEPILVNRPLSDKALELIRDDSFQNFFQHLIGLDELHVRRMQYNILGEGCFVGLHLDTDSNPDYLVAVVIQFGDEFTGGEYVVYGGDYPPRRYSPTKNSIIVSDCNYEHEVTKVTSGKRKSLVFFLSQNNGENKRLMS